VGRWRAALGILRLLVNLRELMLSGLFLQYFIGFELLQLNLLIALPVRIALGHWRFLIRLELILLALVFGYFGFPYLWFYWIGGTNTFVYFGYAWTVLLTLASGAILGRALTVAYNRPELLRAGMRWGALGSLARIAVTFSPFIFNRMSPESTAMMAMLSVLAFVVQGVVAAVPFERTMKRETVA